jgi:protein TonB
MPSYTGTANQPDRAKAIAAVIAVHVGLAAIILTGLNVRVVGQTVERLETFDIRVPPPPPPNPPTPEPKPHQPKQEAGAPAKRAEATPVVAPRPRLPMESPILAAPIAGAGSAATAGAAPAGNGTGAGGSGNGSGGGGSGLISGPRLVAGAPRKSDYHLLGARISASTRAVMRLTIAPNGRVSNCTLVRSSGYPDVDARICPFLAPRMVWAPALDSAGRPATSWLDYVVTLDRT